MVPTFLLLQHSLKPFALGDFGRYALRKNINGYFDQHILDIRNFFIGLSLIVHYIVVLPFLTKRGSAGLISWATNLRQDINS